MAKTADYTLNAVKKYNEKFDRKAVNLPKGTAERIKKLTGKSCNAYIVGLVMADLERLEEEAGKSEEIMNAEPVDNAQIEEDLRKLAAKLGIDYTPKKSQ